MQKRLALVLCAAWGIALCSCSDDEIAAIFDDPEQVQQALENCTHTGVFSMLRLVSEVDEIVEVIEDGFAQDGITVTPSTDRADPDFTWDVSSDLDSSGSGTADTRIAGKITFSEDPTDGIAFGSTADLGLAITSLGGPITGSVDATVTTVDADTITIVGNLSINDSDDGCDISFAIPANPGLSLSDVGLFMEPQLAANVLGILIEGGFDINVNVGGHSLKGTLDLPQLSQNANVTDASIDEVEISDFSFQVAPDPEIMATLGECMFGSLFLFESVIRSIGPLAEEIEDPGAWDNIDITETSPGVYDFEIDTNGSLVGFDLAGIMTGTINVPASPTQPASVTWSMQGDQGLFTASSTSPLMVLLPTQTTAGFIYGGGSVNFPGEPACAGTFSIPADTAMELEAGSVGTDQFGDSGRITFTTTVGSDVLRFTIDLSTEDEIVEATLNGIPIPPEFIFGNF